MSVDLIVDSTCKQSCTLSDDSQTELYIRSQFKVDLKYGVGLQTKFHYGSQF